MLLGFISALLAVVFYQNDFTTRTSANGMGPGLVWSEFKYAKGQPLAYNFLAHNVAYRVICYNWQPQQDGWIKIPYGSATKDCLWSHVTDEDDPCMIMSMTNETHGAFLCHTFRNVFSNGVVKMQFDLRAPVQSCSKNPWCWVRPLAYEKATEPVKGGNNVTAFPIEIGIAGTSLSGGWNVAGSNDGYRAYYSYGKTTAGHWYRHYVSLNLDTSRADFEVYDLGSSRIAMDATPTANPVATKKDCIFRYANNGGSDRGYLNGMNFNVQHLNALKAYGEDGFNSDYAYMIDNIKGSWQSSSGGSFVEFYRNDFSTSRRRTVDGSITASHTFTYDDPVVVTNVYTMYSYLVSKVGRIAPKTSPYLTGIFDKSVAGPQDPGADGWRFAGNTSFDTPVFVVPDANNNNMISCTSFGKNIQPMCEEITSGKIRFEFDQRMPKGWNGTQRCEINLLSQAAWESSTDACADGIIRFGCCGTATGTQASPNKQARAFLAGINAQGQDTTFVCDLGMKMSTWYRFRADVDLDAKTVTYYVYEIGASAPAKPDDFVPGSGNLKGSRSYSLHQPAGYSDGIAAWAICNWNRALDSSEGNDAAEYQTLIDNARLWKLKADGSLGDLIFSNDGSETKRVFSKARKALWDDHLLIDRPEYAEDGIILTPTYYTPNYITGSDHAIQVSDVSYLGITIPLGCMVRSGILRAQYDVRLASNTDYGNTCKVYLGGAQLGSSSQLGTAYPQRFNTGYAISTGVCVWDNYAANGIKSIFYANYDVGNRAGGVTKTASTKINPNGRTEGKWVRVKIVADVDAKKYDVSFYDMGSTHPSFDTPDGTLIFSNGDEEVPFKWATDPISHMFISGGHTPSYAPWLEDAPGACLVDNIRVSRDNRGLFVIVK